MNETTNAEGFANTVGNIPTAKKSVVSKPRKKELKNLTKRDGIWYFHKFVKGKREFNGRKTPFSLETSDLAVAKAKRDALLKAANGGEIDRVLGRTNRAFPTLGAIFAAYRAAPMVRANEKTRERNIADLTRMVLTIKGDVDIESVNTSELTWQLVEAWQTKRLAQARVVAGPDLAAFEAAKRGINSLLASIQSVFSVAARASYRALNLPPNIAEFVAALPVPARKQEAPDHLPDSFVLKLLEKAGELRREDPPTWAAFQLMTWGGLRNSEALHARTGWLERTVYGYRLSLKATTDFLPKGNSRDVMIPSDVAQGLLALDRPIDESTGAIDDHLVPAANRTERVNACYRRLNEWLVNQGVSEEAGKIAYRLRKYFLKKVAVQQHPLMAQVAGGHSSMATTQEHYIGKPAMMEPIRMPVDLSKVLSFRIDQKPVHSSFALGSILNLQQAAALLEVNAGDLAARSEKADSVTLDGFVLTVRRDGLNGALVPAPEPTA